MSDFIHDAVTLTSPPLYPIYGYAAFSKTAWESMAQRNPNGAQLLAAALTPEIRVLYAKNTEGAIQRSVFGSPTYFVDGDMFYGQDRLEMVEHVLQQPFSGKWPRT